MQSTKLYLLGKEVAVVYTCCCRSAAAINTSKRSGSVTLAQRNTSALEPLGPENHISELSLICLNICGLHKAQMQTQGTVECGVSIAIGATHFGTW